jgi:sRNA-binding carbon storage regulator CsrA
MLMLTRKKDERVLLIIPPGFSGEILITVGDIVKESTNTMGVHRDSRVKLGIHAPDEVKIHREELVRNPIIIPTLPKKPKMRK